MEQSGDVKVLQYKAPDLATPAPPFSHTQVTAYLSSSIYLMVSI